MISVKITCGMNNENNSPQKLGQSIVAKTKDDPIHLK